MSALVTALHLAAASNCPTIPSGKYGDAATLTPLAQEDVCTTGCRTTFQQSILTEYKAAASADMNPTSQASDIMKCYCDEGAGMKMFENGIPFWDGPTQLNAMCQSPTCKDKVLNGNDQGSKSYAFIMCLFGVFKNCDANGGAHFNTAADMLTTCMCDAAAAGYNYYYYRDVEADGSAGQLCAVESCAAYIDHLIGNLGLETGSCNPLPIGAIVGGAIPAVLILCGLCGWAWKLHQANMAKNSMAQGPMT